MLGSEGLKHSWDSIRLKQHKEPPGDQASYVSRIMLENVHGGTLK